VDHDAEAERRLGHFRDLRHERDDEIRKALEDGISPSAIARAVGLSRQYIYDIRDAAAS
jgi:DNA invertase Pin-like site-specific DNA recombinase